MDHVKEAAEFLLVFLAAMIVTAGSCVRQHAGVSCGGQRIEQKSP
jgi:hypothetical protein